MESTFWTQQTSKCCALRDPRRACCRWDWIAMRKSSRTFLEHLRYTSGYSKKAMRRRHDSMIGSFRAFRPKFFDRLSWSPWPSEANKSLDKLMWNKAAAAVCEELGKNATTELPYACAGLRALAEDFKLQTAVGEPGKNRTSGWRPARGARSRRCTSRRAACSRCWQSTRSVR